MQRQWWHCRIPVDMNLNSWFAATREVLTKRKNKGKSMILKTGALGSNMSSSRGTGNSTTCEKSFGKPKATRLTIYKGPVMSWPEDFLRAGICTK